MKNGSKKLNIPTLLIWGANDTALGPQLARQVPQFVEDLELHILDDCSHWVQQDRYVKAANQLKMQLSGIACRTLTMSHCLHVVEECHGGCVRVNASVDTVCLADLV